MRSLKKIFFLCIFLIFSFSEARTFLDSSDYLWAASVVDEWSDRGIISGYIDGSFKGNNNLKRSEMITVINRLNNSKENMGIKPSRDVDVNDWYYNEMSIALKNGLIELDENFNLRPNDYATREEVFVILSKLFKLKYNGNSAELLASKFNDYHLIDGENHAYVAALVSEGYISGYGDNTLKPKALITRAELIAIIDKIVEELYSSGEVEDKLIIGNVVINGENVSLNNVNIMGNVFVMDGAREGVTVLKNIDCTKGIISRVENVLIEGNDKENSLKDKETIEPVFINAKYSEEDWTNEDVVATISFNDKDYKVINNSGSKKYTFEQNGEFIFLAKDDNANIVEFKAKVSNIDKISPKLITEVETQTDKATINVTVEDDGLSQIEGIYYMKGINTSSRVAKYGDEVENNVLEVTEEGKYTIMAEDEAGNRARKIVTIRFGVSD